MEIYDQSAHVLKQIIEKPHHASIKQLVLNNDRISNKKTTFALVTQCVKLNAILQKIIDQISWKKNDKQFYLYKVWIYEFFYAKKRNRKYLQKQFCRQCKMFASFFEKYATEIQKAIEKVKSEANEEETEQEEQPLISKYIRINTLKPPSNSNWKNEFMDNIIEDEHIPNLFKISNSKNFQFHQNSLIQSGNLIIQDKASCLPVFILHQVVMSLQNSLPKKLEFMDTCSAPGNKTSYLASLFPHSKIYAIERSKNRFETLKKRIALCQANSIVSCFHADFIKDINAQDYKQVTCMVVDPSCSGSGIVNREEYNKDTETDQQDKSRLLSLAAIQISILEKALSFPNVKIVMYSTCSIHREENEQVVEQVLQKVGHSFTLFNFSQVSSSTLLGKTYQWMQQKLDKEDDHYFFKMHPKVHDTNGFFVACFVHKSIY